MMQEIERSQEKCMALVSQVVSLLQEISRKQTMLLRQRSSRDVKSRYGPANHDPMFSKMRQEAQAIVLAAGPGMRMTTLTNRTPKCLLPLGTLPMIYYPLHSLQEAGFEEVTVIVSGTAENEVRKLAEQYGLKIILDIVTVNTADDPGTADSLRHIAHKIKHNVDDVLIVSCDLVSDAPIHVMMDQHRASGAALTLLAAPINPDYAKASAPGPKMKQNMTSDILCMEEDTGRLMFAVAGGDYDEALTLSGSVMNSTTRPITVSSALQDAHFYAIKRWLLNYIISEQTMCANMGSIKDEVIPHVISQQFAKLNNKEKAQKKTGIMDLMEGNEYEDLICKYNTSYLPSRYNNSQALDGKLCQVFYHKGTCIRANNLNTYWHLNKMMHSLFSQVCPESSWEVKHSSANINSKAQMSPDTMVGASTSINEKTNVSSSVIGNHCCISPYTRISSSVLTDHVSIASGCVIENSLIATSIEKKCTIKNCIVTDSSKIDENGTYDKEILEASQAFA